MDDLEEYEDRPIEHFLIAFACTIQLRQSKLQFDELLFLKGVVDKNIEEYEREIH